MSIAIQKIQEQFLKLAPDEQAEALEQFAKTVYGEDDEGPELIAVLRRRLAQIEAGEVAGRDAFEVLAQLRAKHSR